jgi:hypothetical protein
VRRLLVTILWLLTCTLCALSCNQDDSQLRAKVIEHRSELVGGPVAMADVGDYLLENDQMRVAILRAIDSPGPGVFGGSVVDIDRRRPLIGAPAGMGHDRFAESFPIANLMVPEPESVDISVLKDGSDGQEAAIRVEGTGEFMFEALAILRTKQPLLDLLFPDVVTQLRFVTDYILRPGARHILVRTTLRMGDTPLEGCPSVNSCGQSCPNGFARDDEGCLICECTEALPLDQFDAPENMFGVILGDNPSEGEAVHRAGVVAGDFVFFGNQNDVFAPGPGFDEDIAVQDAQNSGRNTFQTPLVYDFVAAAGGDVSYGYFSLSDSGGASPQINVPLFASAATAFLVGAKRCLLDESDDAECDRNTALTYERYLVVGDGDIASITEEMYRVRGTPTGELKGHVLWADTGTPAPNAQLFVFSDPEPGRAWESLDALTRANIELRGDVGLVNAIDADLGLDRVEDGDFRAVLPEGNYVVVARDADGTATSPLTPFGLRAGSTLTLVPALPQPATVVYRIVDETGSPVPAKLTFVALDGEGRPLLGDGRRRVYLGDGRLGNGVRSLRWSHDGSGETTVEPGRYRIIVSRGIEYGLYTVADVELKSGSTERINATLVREIDTRGWMSADMHLHSTPSFDSGFPIARRVVAVAAEGVEFAVSTDHDVATFYEPTVRELSLEPYLKTAVGAEITTVEQGHFLGFPIRYDALTVPAHGAHDWVCQAGDAILDGIRATGDEMTPLTIVAHPRDGFFGYFDQLGVDGYRFDRTPTLLEEENPVFRTAGCNFDAMELINAKRFDLVRTPTVGEVVDWNRCRKRIDLAETEEDLATACPEISDTALVACAEGERYASCRDRNRTQLAWEMQKRILTRTPTEQASDWAWPGTQKETQAACDLQALGNAPIPDGTVDMPCAYRPGHVDDYFRLLEHGMIRSQIASSDSHGPDIEPGSPRTYFRSATDSPAAVRVEDVVDTLRSGHAFTTYGPFIRASIDGKTFGETTSTPAGSTRELHLDVLSASWFGVDRVEIYLNGQLRRVLSPDQPASAIVDVRGKVTFTVPDRDSWVVIIAMGLDDGNLMAPVVLDVPYGEPQLAKIAADAFSRIPVVNELFSASATVPDWSRIPPYAVTNPIFIDTDGNGRYDAPRPAPTFCSRDCDPNNADPAQCPVRQTCLPREKACGFPISGGCNRRVAMPGHP